MMSSALGIVVYILAFLFVLSIVVIVHEAGHFFAARRLGVDVVTFSIGFGKTLWSRKDKKGTTWRIALIPMGGYVQMLGDEDAASAKKSTKGLSKDQVKRTFAAQKVWKRIAIIFAGPFMNYLFAIILLTGVIATVGVIKIPAVVGEVVADSAAEKAGLLAGDLILSVDGKDVSDFSELQRTIAIDKFGKARELSVKRGDETLSLAITPVVQDDVPRIGIRASEKVDFTHEKHNLFEAFGMATKMAYQMTADTLIYLGQVVTGSRSASDMRGPLGIAEASGEAAKSGAFALLMFIIQVSIAIGFVNLLPVPVLDGGHIVLLIVEGITGKELNEKAQGALLKVGIILLLFVFAYTLYKDTGRLIGRIFGS